MKIAIGNDHAAAELKLHVKEYLEGKGHEVIDFGSAVGEKMDYPRPGEAVAKCVAAGDAERGILICGTGVGISLAANKVHGTRCACVSEPVSAMLCRAHNDCRLIAFGARIVGAQMAEAIVDAFLNTEFEGGRHARRVGMIMNIEKTQSCDGEN